MAELDAQRAQRLGDDFGLVGTKEDDIAIDRADAIEDHVEVVFRNDFFKQKTAYVIDRRDWSSDVCSSESDRKSVV